MMINQSENLHRFGHILSTINDCPLVRFLSDDNILVNLHIHGLLCLVFVISLHGALFLQLMKFAIHTKTSTVMITGKQWT